jgi:phosphoribosylanthranilate isomerase
LESNQLKIPKIKICGITNLEDAFFAIDCGADALGFVFYPPSPRYISTLEAAKIIKQLPPFITVVGLFVNESESMIKKTISEANINLLQFHGDENSTFCERFNFPYIKAFRVKADTDLVSLEQQFTSAKGLLLDTYVKGIPGGTGETFNWDLIPEKRHKPIILAGGLTVQNVLDAMIKVRPYAVDVSGGVEKVKGKKDHVKLFKFMQQRKIFSHSL